MDWEKEPADRIVCSCFGIDKGKIIKAITDGATTFSAVSRLTRAGGSCGVCISDIEKIIEIYTKEIMPPKRTNTNGCPG